jgi:hypothetical protein
MELEEALINTDWLVLEPGKKIGDVQSQSQSRKPEYGTYRKARLRNLLFSPTNLRIDTSLHHWYFLTRDSCEIFPSSKRVTRAVEVSAHTASAFLIKSMYMEIPQDLKRWEESGKIKECRSSVNLLHFPKQMTRWEQETETRENSWMNSAKASARTGELTPECSTNKRKPEAESSSSWIPHNPDSKHIVQAFQHNHATQAYLHPPFIRHVGVIWFVYHVLQLLPIRSTQQNSCCISKSTVQ